MLKSAATALALVVAFALCASACLGNKAPTLSPSAGTAITNGLTALSTILQARGVSPAVTNGITTVEQDIAKDVAGTTWGGLVRDLLTGLYTNLPLTLQNDPVVWASLAGLEIAEATVGA